MIDGRNFTIVSDEDKKADSLKRVLESILPSAAVKTYRFDDFTPPKYGADFNRDKPIVIIVASSILDYTKEVNTIRRLRISRDLTEDVRKVPIFLLIYESHLNIIKRYSDGILLLSEGCTIIQIPFKIDYLKIKIETAKGVKDFDSLRDFLHIESRLTQIEKQDKHGLANYLGPIRLLRGAYLSGEFGNAHEDGKRLYDNITTYLKQKQHSIDYYNEYLDWLETFGFVTEMENEKEKEEKKLSDKVKGRSILYIDDEHKNGWSKVLKELLIPNSDEWQEKDYAWVIEDSNKTKLCCVSKVGKSERIDDFGNIEELLGLKDQEKKWINYDIILLDLRLKKESPTTPVKATSGYLLLEAIRKKDPTVPVIMFTASEKATTMQVLQQLGISGYFIKEFSSRDDFFSMVNFDTFKKLIIDIIDMYSLRDIWFYIVEFDEKFSLGLKYKFKKKYVNLLKTAYFKIRNYDPFNSYSRYDNNMAVLHYHECLDLYTKHDASLSIVDDKMTVADRIKKLEQPYKKVAECLNKLRNKVVHDDKCNANRWEAVNGFLCILFILSKSKLPHCRYSVDFNTFMDPFCNETLPPASSQLKKAELERSRP